MAHRAGRRSWLSEALLSFSMAKGPFRRPPHLLAQRIPDPPQSQVSSCTRIPAPSCPSLSSCVLPVPRMRDLAVIQRKSGSLVHYVELGDEVSTDAQRSRPTSGGR